MPSLKKMNKMEGVAMPHVGEMVETIMLKKRVSKAELARGLDIHAIGINRYLEQATMHAALLWKIGKILNHNFFADLAEQFPLIIDASSEEGLKKQLAELQKENELYKKLLVREPVI